MFIALCAIGVLAVTGGIYIGIQARVTAEQLTEEHRAEAEASDFDEAIRKARMDELEAARNRR